MDNKEIVIVSPVNGEPLKQRNDGFYEAKNDSQLYIYENDQLTALLSPAGKPMVPRDDGLFYSEEEGLYYKLTSNDLIPLISPIDGSPLVPDGRGGFDSSYDDLVYEVHNDIIVPLVTPDGMPITRIDNGLYYCDADDKMYEITDKGRVNSVTEEELERREQYEEEQRAREEAEALEEQQALEEEQQKEREQELEEEKEVEEVSSGEDLYNYDDDTANIIINSYILGEITKEVIEETFKGLGLTVSNELLEQIDLAKEEFLNFMNEYNKENVGNKNSLEGNDRISEIEQIFEEYNTKSFMDPIKAYKLNREYKELTGNDNSKFLDETSTVIATLNRDKSKLIEKGVRDQRYFDTLVNISEYVKLKNEINNKNNMKKSM